MTTDELYEALTGRPFERPRDRGERGADRASKALQAAGLGHHWNGVAQLLSDLRHFCRVNNLDMDELEIVAYNNAAADLALDRKERNERT